MLSKIKRSSRMRFSVGERVIDVSKNRIGTIVRAGFCDHMVRIWPSFFSDFKFSNMDQIMYIIEWDADGKMTGEYESNPSLQSYNPTSKLDK